VPAVAVEARREARAKATTCLGSVKTMAKPSGEETGTVEAASAARLAASDSDVMMIWGVGRARARRGETGRWLSRKAPGQIPV
jgi:hypothetical protein